MKVECPSCGNEVRRVFEPPRIRVMRRQLGRQADEACEGDTVNWHAPGQGYPGSNPFEVVAVEERDLIIRPYDAPSEPCCMGCWTGCVWPALHPYLDNKPRGLMLRDWRNPIWRARWQLRSAKPRPRRVSQNCYWPHINGHMGITMPRHDIGVPLVIIDDREPLPREVPSFGADWPAIRERVIARLRAKNPHHPWVQGEYDTARKEPM